MAKGIKTGGRTKGTPNKTTALLKDAILLAARKAGGDTDDGIVVYLTKQANDSPAQFLALLGKVLPMQVTGVDDEPIEIVVAPIRNLAKAVAGVLAKGVKAEKT